MDENRKKLYDQLSANYDMGTFDEFDSDLDNEDNQKVAWEAMGGQDGYGDFSMFQQAIQRSPQVAEPQQAEPAAAQPITTQPDATQPDAAPLMETQQPAWTTTASAMPSEEDADADISLPDAPNPSTPKDAGAVSDGMTENTPDVVSDHAEDYSTKSVEELKSNIGVPADKDVTQHDIDSRVTYIESIVDPVQKQAEYDKLMQSLDGLNRYAQAERDAERVVQSIPAEAKVAQHAETVDPAWAKRDEAYGRLVRDGVDHEGKKAPSAAQRGIAKNPKRYNDNIMRVRQMSDDELRRGYATVMDSTAYGADDERRAVDAVPYIIEMNARANGGHAQTMGEEVAKEYLAQHPELKEAYNHWKSGDEGYRSDVDKDPAAAHEVAPFAIADRVLSKIDRRINEINKSYTDEITPDPRKPIPGGVLRDPSGAQLSAMQRRIYDLAEVGNLTRMIQDAFKSYDPVLLNSYIAAFAEKENTDIPSAKKAVADMVLQKVRLEILSRMTPENNAAYASYALFGNTFAANILKAGLALMTSKPGETTIFGLEDEALANYGATHQHWWDQVVRGAVAVGTLAIDAETIGFSGPSFLSGLAGRVVANRASNVFLNRLLTSTISGAVNFGTFEAQTEWVNQLKTGERNIGKIFTRFGGGLAKGAAFGTVNSAVDRLFWNARGWVVPFGEAVKILGETAVFSGIGYLETGKLTAEDLGTNFGMVMSGKVKDPVGYIRDVQARMEGKRYLPKINRISKEYAETLSQKGYSIISSILRTGRVGREQLIGLDGELNKMRSDNTVPWETLRMAEYALDGRLYPSPPATKVKIERGEDSAWTFTPTDNDGRAVGESITVKGTEAKKVLGAKFAHEIEKNNLLIKETASWDASVCRELGKAVLEYCKDNVDGDATSVYKIFMTAHAKHAAGAKLGDVEREIYFGVNARLKDVVPTDDVSVYKAESKRAGYDLDRIVRKPADERSEPERIALKNYIQWLDGREVDARDLNEYDFKEWAERAPEVAAENSARIAKEFEEKADEFHAHLEDLSGKMDLGNVVVLEHVDQVADAKVRQQIERSERMGEKGVPGWYDADTDTTYVYLPHNENIEDLDRTIMHEQVSHHGLRVLKTQGYNDLCDRVWNSMSDAERDRWENYPGVKGIDDQTKRQRAAADEYIAHLAERTDPENEGRWKSFVANAKEQMRKFGIRTDRIGDAELERIIRESYRNLREGRDGDAANGTAETERGNEAALDTEGEASREETAEPATEEVIAPTETVETPPAAESGETPPPVAEPPVVESEPKVERPTSAVGRVEGTPADMNDWAELLAENDADSLPVEEVQAGLELMEREREQAHRYANGELAEEPSDWEYWAARDGLSEPTRQAEPAAAEPPATDTPKEPVAETESQHTEPVATEAPTETAQRDTKLPKGADAEAETMEPSELPMTEHITKMTDAWGDVTRVEVVGQNDNGTTRVRLWFKNRDQRGVETDVDLRGTQPPETPTPPTEPTGDATTADTTTDVTTERPAEVTGSADDQQMRDKLGELLGGDADRIADAQARLNDPNASEFEKQAARTVLRYRQRDGRDGVTAQETEGDGVRFRVRDDERRPTFYSNAERAVENVKQGKATAEQWKAMLTKAGGIKAGEDKWMGLTDWLDEHKGQSLTKDDVLQFVRDNGIEMREVNYGTAQNDAIRYYIDEFDELIETNNRMSAFEEMERKYGDEFTDAFYLNDNYELEVQTDYNGDLTDSAARFLGISKKNYVRPSNSTRLNYTTRGLTNKREIAFVVPGIEPYQEGDEIHFGPENEGRAVMWVRFGETTDKDGNRVLVIDEIQSNRHQNAREKGYKGHGSEYERLKQQAQNTQDAYFEQIEEYARTADGRLDRTKLNRAKEDDPLSKALWEQWSKDERALRQYNESHGFSESSAIPAAPFEKNWHEVAMKRMLRLAADEGFDKVAWTTGEQQAQRYNLEAVVESIDVDRGQGDLFLTMQDGTMYDMGLKPDGTLRSTNELFSGKHVNDVFGKEMGERILSVEGQKKFSGEGLHIGGEGMKGFYDEILPRFMNKYGKKWGSKVGDVKLSTPGGEVMHSVDVTEPMKESVMQGQPLFRVRRAPNGKESNLDERQYDEVRTGNFKKWFGDWENDPEEASKVVDENGEPLVVYHQTNRKQYINRKTGQNWDDLDWREREEWDRRSDEEWNDTWEEQDFYTFDNRHARQSVEYPGFFFSPRYDEYHEYGDRTIAAYLDMKNPAIDPDIPNAGVTDTAGRDAMESLMRQGYDGVIRTEDGVPYEYIVFRPEQIKSATENNGDFSRESGDIRLRAREVADASPDGVGERLREEGIESDSKGDIRFSHRFPLNDEQRKRSVDDIMRVTGASRRKVTKWLKDVQSLTGLVLSDPDTYANYTPDDRYNAIKTNSDYPQGTVDFNNICRKRKDLTAVWSILQRENPNRIFTAADLETIRQTLIEDGYDVACGLCFVEGRRKFLGEIAQGFIDDMKNGTLKPEVKEILGDETYIPTIEELLVPASSDKLRAEHPQVYDAFVRFNNARGQQAGRLYENYGEYKREILNWDNRKVKAVNDVGGLRIFSFSDFEAHHLLDIVQIIYDCAARGVKIQGYTKVPSFAKAMRATGLKLNRSLIPAGTGIKEVDGKKVLDYDTTEGIDINDRDFLDEESNPNVGNILVGISDEHIRLAMLDPFVDYIIPYHASGIGIELRKLKGIDHWENYTNSQHDIDKSTGKSAKKQINIYTDVLQAAEAEGRPIRNKREFVEKFLDVARERGLEPRFSQFLNKDKNGNYVYTEGYHKFLIDFKLFDKRGRLVPQEVVRPEFDSDYLKQVLDEYAEGEKVTKDYTSTLSKLRERLGLNQGGDVRLRVRDGRHGSAGIEGLRGERSGHEAAVEDARRRLESDDASEFERQAARAVIKAYGGGSGDAPDGGGPRFRIREPQKAIDDYERAVNSRGFQVTEALQDSMMGLKKLMQAIVGKDAKGKEKAIQDIAGFENAYLKENRLQSESVAQVDEYRTRYYTPLVKAVSALIGKGGKKHRTEATAELTDYMMAKHGLERNLVLAERDATEEFESDANKDGNGNYIRNYDDILAEKREKDYSGLTALTGEADVAAAEDAARQMVDDYEMSHDTTELWQRTKEATDATLDKLHDSGVLSDEAYDRAKTMFEYYIPLRGWDETTSDEVYGYLTGPDGPLNGNVFKHAEGRRSKADDPLATIMMMASDAIRQGNRNVMKQRFLTFVLNNPSDAVSVNRLWLQRDPVTDKWKPVFADLDPADSPEVVRQKVEQFEQDMAQLAQQDPDNFKHGKQTENIPYKVVNGNIGEHRVLVKHNGQTYVMTINGNPRAAQALNGLTNPDTRANNFVGKTLGAFAKLNRVLSQLFTTYSPKFVVRNFARDMGYSIASSAFVKEGGEYGGKFVKNYAKVGLMGKLFSKWESGTLDRSDTMENLFYEFMHNGGETGFSAPKELKDYKKALDKELRKENSKTRQLLGSFGEFYLRANRAVENRARFSAFLTSMEMGRGIDRSIWDAKEVSVNFNKKGAGAKMFDNPDQTLAGKTAGLIGDGGRSLFVFWNASVQGLTNYGKTFKAHPVKATAHASLLAGLAYMMPQLMQAIFGDDDGYYDLPDYVRRNNICFRWSKDMPWITIPLSPEHAVSYAIGDIIAGIASGKKQYLNGEEIANDFAKEVSKALPLDFTEGGGGHWWLPSAIKPAYEAYEMNESWTGAPIANQAEWNEHAPEYQRVYKTASQPFVKASEWVNDMTNSDEDSKGLINFNPSKLEYVFKGYAGGLATLFNDCVRMFDVAFGDAEFEAHDIPVAGAMLKSGNPTTKQKEMMRQYYHYRDDAEGAKWELKNREGDALERFKQTDRYERYLVWTEMSKDVDKLKKQMKDNPDLEAEYYAAVERLVSAMREQHAGKRKPSQETIAEVKESERKDSIEALTDKQVHDAMVPLSDSAPQDSVDVKREGIKRAYKSEGLSYSKPNDDAKNALAYERRVDYFDIDEDKVLKGRRDALKKSVGEKFEKMGVKYKKGSAGWDWYADDDASASIDEIKAYYQSHKAELDEYGILSWWFGSSKGSSGYIKKGFTDGKHDPDEVMKEYREARKEVLAKTKQR